MFIYTCTSERDALEKCQGLRTTQGSGKWFFRGQRDSTWGLLPSLLRPGAQIDDPKEFERSVVTFAGRLLREKTTIADSLVGDEDVLLAMAQHYGVRTRLLDWTHDPEIALYFAASGALRNPPSSGLYSVFAVASIYINAGVAGQKAKLVFPPRAANPNLAAQRGLLMKHKWDAPDLWEQTSAKETADPVGNVSSLIDTRLVRLDIPADRAGHTVELLTGRGLDASVIFPGEHGIARFAEDMARLDKVLAAKLTDKHTFFVKT